MNNLELKNRVHTAMYELIRENGVASPVEVLMKIGVLSPEKYEDWRFGRNVPYLERVCQVNLSKLSTINCEIRVFAQKNNLKPSWTYYKQWGKNKKGNKKTVKLRFSKSGDKNVEKLYATHYISSRKVEEANKQRKTSKDEEKLNIFDTIE